MRYPVKESKHSSHSQIVELLGHGRGRRVLDVGCADGQLSARLTSNSWLVTGVEPFAAEAEQARARGIRVLDLSLEQAIQCLDEKFDAVVLADVLEHTTDPWAQLSGIRALCEPDALIVMSIPNVAHFFIRAQLAFGRFDYQERGILDRTHLRFFTRRTVLEMLDGAGLHCETLSYSPTPLEVVVPRLLAAPWGRAILDVNAAAVRVRPTLLGYQVIVACRYLPDGA